MTKVPDLVAEFLRGKRFAVAGVSRHSGQAANAIYRKLARFSGSRVDSWANRRRRNRIWLRLRKWL